MSELSKRLCEIVGIKAKPMPSAQRGMFQTSDIVFKYPNFETNAENFVRLLELQFKDGFGLCDWLLTYAGSFFDRKNFLEILINLLESKMGYLQDDINNIIQALQNEEWSYE